MSERNLRSFARLHQSAEVQAFHSLDSPGPQQDRLIRTTWSTQHRQWRDSFRPRPPRQWPSSRRWISPACRSWTTRRRSFCRTASACRDHRSSRTLLSTRACLVRPHPPAARVGRRTRLTPRLRAAHLVQPDGSPNYLPLLLTSAVYGILPAAGTPLTPATSVRFPRISHRIAQSANRSPPRPISCPSVSARRSFSSAKTSPPSFRSRSGARTTS